MVIYYQARDCLNLWHVYLTKREIASRHVKSRSFAGVDIKELDLINPPTGQATTSSQAASETTTSSIGDDKSSTAEASTSIDE